jgi:hypothetical protein
LWGNHLTLIAFAEICGAKITIISSSESLNYVTDIIPKTLKDGVGREELRKIVK